MERVEGSAKLLGNQRASVSNRRFHFNARKKMQRPNDQGSYLLYSQRYGRSSGSIHESPGRRRHAGH